MLEIKLRTEKEIIQKWSSCTKPLVSICCITYNHEEYVEDALKGFLMQETDFPFEILIHDDASLDKTANIIRGYSKRYPKIIKPIIQNENQYSKGRSVSLDFNLLRAKGKYIAICEGDDYWTDPIKLTKQVSFLEKNSEFAATYHNVDVIDENGILINEKRNLYREFSEYTYTIKEAEKLKLPSQTATLTYKNLWLNADRKLIEAYRGCKANGDIKLAVLLALNGNIYCMSDTMAVHRKVYTKGTSWSAVNYNKNITLYAYTSLLEINKFVFNISGIIFNNKSERLTKFYSALKYLLKKPSKENMVIMKKLLELNQDTLTEVIVHIVKKFVQLPFRKMKMLLEK